jgi:hypothetical protein
MDLADYAIKTGHETRSETTKTKPGSAPERRSKAMPRPRRNNNVGGGKSSVFEEVVLGNVKGVESSESSSESDEDIDVDYILHKCPPASLVREYFRFWLKDKKEKPTFL